MTPVRWAAEHGLLWYRDWDLAEMPREVALALRGPGYHAPFTPVPPPVDTAPVDQAAVDQDAAVAAGHLLDRAGALIDLAARTPIATIKTGGVGQREIKRLGKALSCREDEIRILLETAFDAGLLGRTEAGVQATGAGRDWAGQDPAEQYATLATAWWSGERSALATVDGARPAALAVVEHAEVGVAVRRALLAALARLPEQTRVDAADDDPAGIAEYVAWLCPVYPDDLIEESLPAALTEAALVGGLSRGAASALGRALVAGDDLTAVARDLLTVTRQTALLGADLTAVVTGPPSAELARVLDRLADREARGTASVWRFSPASVRRAFDAGYPEDQILADLTAVAAAGVPQPLEYLVKDVARRHGEVRVTEVVCVLRGTDEALLAEIAAHRKLARLGLRALTPTVLASDLPLTQTLAALREAGYAPVPADADGVSTIKRAVPPRPTAPAGKAVPAGKATPAGKGRKTTSPARSGRRSADGEPEIMDVHRLAAHLRTTEIPEPMSERETEAAIARWAGQLPAADRFNLGYLICYGTPMQVRVRVDDGAVTWSLESGELTGETLFGWRPETQNYQRVPLSSIVRVRR
jgi:hypothetical protein